MKRNVALSEISDGKLYTARDLVRADCHGCQGCFACCRGMGDTIVLDPYDVWRLTFGLESSFSRLLEEGKLELGVVDDGLILPHLAMSGGKETCAFLDERGRCGIHPHRPGICRMFPLGRVYQEDGSFRYFLQTGECVCTTRSKIRVQSMFDTPEFSRYERYVAVWHGFLKELEELMRNGGDEELAKRVNLFQLEYFFVRDYDGRSDFYEQFEARLSFVRDTLQELTDRV